MCVCVCVRACVCVCVCVCVCLCVCVYDHCLTGSQGDLRTEDGMQSVFEQLTEECSGGIQHVFASLRGCSSWWQVMVYQAESLAFSFSFVLSTFNSLFLLLILFRREGGGGKGWGRGVERRNK